MKNINLSKFITKLVCMVFLFLSIMELKAVGPGGNPMPPANPIDMYEGILLIIAVSILLGYHIYTKNRKSIS